jgi:hypothetical protein
MAEFYLMTQYANSVSYDVILNHFHVAKYTALQKDTAASGGVTIDGEQYVETNVYYYECAPFIKVYRDANMASSLSPSHRICDPTSISYMQIPIKSHRYFKCQYVRPAKCTYIFADLYDVWRAESPILSQITPNTLFKYTCAVSHTQDHYAMHTDGVTTQTADIVIVVFGLKNATHYAPEIGGEICRILHNGVAGTQLTPAEQADLAQNSCTFIDAFTIYDPTQLDLRDYQYAPKMHKLTHIPRATASCGVSRLNNDNDYCVYDFANDLIATSIKKKVKQTDLALKHSFATSTTFGKMLMKQILSHMAHHTHLDAYNKCKCVNVLQLCMSNPYAKRERTVGMNHIDYTLPVNYFYVTLWPSSMSGQLDMLVCGQSILTNQCDTGLEYSQYVVS